MCFKKQVENQGNGTAVTVYEKAKQKLSEVKDGLFPPFDPWPNYLNPQSKPNGFEMGWV